MLWRTLVQLSAWCVAACCVGSTMGSQQNEAQRFDLTQTSLTQERSHDLAGDDAIAGDDASCVGRSENDGVVFPCCGRDCKHGSVVAKTNQKCRQ